MQNVSTKKSHIQPLEKSYLQYGYLSPEKIQDRIQANTVHISYLKGKVTADIRGSSLFQLGYQEINEYFERLFKTLSASLQGEQPVINAASSELFTQFGTCHSRYSANHLTGLYTDIYETTVGGIRTKRIPSKQMVDQLRALLKDNFQEIQGQFAQVLRKEGRMIVQNVNLDSRDSSYLQYSLLQPFSMLFPKRSDTLKLIYASLLEIEWLEYDQTQLTGYLESTQPLLTKSPSPKPHTKYNNLFKNRGRFSLSPHERLKANLSERLHLQDQMAKSFHYTFLFEAGEQEDNAHFQELFKSFFAEVRGAESLVKAAAEILTNRFRGYDDVCEKYQVKLSEPIYRNGTGEFGSGGYTQTHTTHRRPRGRVLQELHNLIESNCGLKRRFLEALRQEGRKLTEGLKVTDRDYSYLRAPDHPVQHYPVMFFGYLFPSCQAKLQDIFTKLLVTTWLEEDSKELSIYLGLKEPTSETLLDVPPAFIFQEKIYGLRLTKPDGTCGLHALLGDLHEGEYVCLEDPRQTFIQKIQENFQDAKVKEAILEILLDHLNAQEDPSSQMLFESPEGNRLNQTFLEIRNGFQTQVKALKKEEAGLWFQEMPSIREKVLEEARMSAQYAEMEEEAILNALQDDKLKLLSLISPEREPFSKFLSPEKKGQIVLKAFEQQEVLERWSDTEAHFLADQLYPHYLTALASGEFFLNTQEVTLAALLFHKKAQVVHAEGEAATEVVFPDGEGEPSIIYHEGCHFSRCTPYTQEEIAILTDPEKLGKVNQNNQDAFDYMQAKSLADNQRRKDLYLLQRYRSSLKEEAAQLAISGGLSIATGTPLPIIMQLSRTTINTAGSYIDPLGESQEIQVLKLIGNSGFVHLLGGNMVQVGTALAVDLASLATQEKDMSESKTTARNLGFGILKGVVTLDPEKCFKQASTTIVSEFGRNIVPQEHESDDWEQRFFRALFTNADLQGALVDHAFKDSFKEPPKPKFSESLDPEEQAKYPQQVLPKDGEKQATQIPNPEIQRQIDDALIEYTKEDAICKDKQLGTQQATEHLDEKHQNWDKKWKHGTSKEEKNAWGKYESAKTKVTDAEATESKHKTIVDNLEDKIEALKQKLYIPAETPSSPQKQQGSKTDQLTPAKNALLSSVPDRSHLLDVPPSPVGLRVEVLAEKKSNSYGGHYLIYYLILNQEGHAPKDIGEFTSKSKALGAAAELNSLARQIDFQNQESYRLQAQYEALGLSSEELPKTLHFKQMYFEIEASKEKVKLYLDGQKVYETKDAGKALDVLKQKGAQQIHQNNGLLGTYKNIVGQRVPAHIEAPKGHLGAPVDSKDSKYHHLSYLDAQGKTQTLGKYQKGDDAEHVASGWTHFQAESLSQETQMFDAQKKLLSQGIPIEEIPPRPSLETPTINGTSSNKNFGKTQASRVRNEQTTQTYLQKLEGLAKEPLKPQGLTPLEIRSLEKKMMPKIKDPKGHGFCYKAWRKPGQKLTELSNWLDEKGIQVSGDEIGRVSFDLYQMKQPQSTSYDPGGYGIPQSPTPAQSTTTQWTWQDTQAHQVQQFFEQNMAYQSPSPSTSAPLDYSWMIPEGTTPSFQLPPTDFSSLGRSSPPSISSQVPHRPMQLAGFVPYIPGGAQSDPVQKLLVNDFTKSVPKGPMKIAAAIMTLMLPDMSDVEGAECPKAHFKKVTQNVLKKYDQVVEIKDPHSFGAKSGEFVGELIALGGIGKVIRVAEGISVFGMACEGGFVGAVVAEAHDTNKVAGVAFGFAGGAGTGKLMKVLFRTEAPQPLIDRALTIKPEAFGQQIKAIEAIQQPFYRSGVVTDKMATKLAQQNLRKSQIAFNFTGSAAKQLSRQERAIPMHILEDVIRNPVAVTKDPQGALKGARMYYSRMYRNGKLYNVEVLYDKELNQISHFVYDTKAMGPLEMIKNRVL